MVLMLDLYYILKNCLVPMYLSIYFSPGKFFVLVGGVSGWFEHAEYSIKNLNFKMPVYPIFCEL